MKWFSPLYARVMHWAGHPHAPFYLAGLSFAESSFFPVPPDVMLAPMVAARRERAWGYALVATLGSVAGGLLGYAIGYFALELVEPFIYAHGYGPAYDRAQAWFEQWGVWVVFLAGFTPIPYKLFTISAGALAMSLPPFVLASLVGRGARFFLVAALVWWLGPRVEPVVRRYIDAIGWATVAIVGVLGLWIWLRG